MDETIADKKLSKLVESNREQITGLKKKEYKRKYPDEVVDFAEIIMVDDMKRTALETYQEFKYPDEYIEKANKKQWQTTAGFTIYKTMGEAPRILISKKLEQINTFMHENTHVNDFYDFCFIYNYLDLNFMDFLKVPEFEAIYLLSEYRARYRDTLYLGEKEVHALSGRSLDFQAEKRFMRLNKDLANANEQRNLEHFQYIIMRFLGRYSAFTKLYPQKSKEIEKSLIAYNKGMFNLNQFLYPLKDLTIKNLSFKELGPYIKNFRICLDPMYDFT